MKLSLFIVSFHLGLLISCIAANSNNVVDAIEDQKQQKSWCVVTVGASADPAKLESFVDRACFDQLDCKPIRYDGSCFDPNTVQNHASYVLNLVYRATGVCTSGLGTITPNDPCRADPFDSSTRTYVLFIDGGTRKSRLKPLGNEITHSSISYATL
ncbi:hypothetical protein C2S53_007219 [Perilla frutescens var. hirtella]|uniref:X8 domain-containing protein n=1 Tax=Perilla frutescens var. hirtella TaxID=608512 RepID=A0AAD4P9V6_PERFH|nr:hypothetical protein C2S53_007219 [Perilla frutescens var. hirtella]